MAVTIFLLPGWAFANPINEITQGTLVAKDLKTGLHAELPRLSTDVEINVTGPIARAHVTQRFSNPSDQWTEALFAFPLPENAAVDTLHMVIGGRTVVGKIKEKDEARKTYEAAKASGQRTALDEQHRPNIFSAAVANIPPMVRLKSGLSISISWSGRIIASVSAFLWRLRLGTSQNGSFRRLK